MFLTQYRLPLQEQAKWARSCLNEQAGQSAAATLAVPHAAYAGSGGSQLRHPLDQNQEILTPAALPPLPTFHQTHLTSFRPSLVISGRDQQQMISKCVQTLRRCSQQVEVILVKWFGLIWKQNQKRTFDWKLFSYLLFLHPFKIREELYL